MIRHLKNIGASLKTELRVSRLILNDKRTPRFAKVLLASAIGYAMLPFDLIPDAIPIIGYLDDAIIVPALIIAALRMIPREVMAECRDRANNGRIE